MKLVSSFLFQSLEKFQKTLFWELATNLKYFFMPANLKPVSKRIHLRQLESQVADNLFIQY